jgi:hypothetical protein
MINVEEKTAQEIIVQFIDNDNNVAHSVSTPQKLNINPFDFNLNDFLPNEKPLSLDVFFELASKVIKNAQKNIKENKEIKLIEEYPPETLYDYGNEVITFRVIERKPGMMDKKGSSRPQRKSMYSYEYLDQNSPNQVITVETRPVDHIIEFNCWAVNNKLANKTAIWLEKLLINTAFVFVENGAERFFWKERKSDTYVTVGNQRIFSRPIHFFLRFREFDAKAYSTLRSFFIENHIINTKN